MKAIVGKVMGVAMSLLMFGVLLAMAGNAGTDMAGGIGGIMAPIVVLGAVVLGAVKQRNGGYDMAAVDVEMWVREIIKRLWKDNMFLSRAFNEDQYVLGGAVVHIPQPGAAPNVVKNRNTYPAVAVRRTDTDVTYTLGDYTTDPTHIPDVDLATISYDKTTSIIQDLYGYLNQFVADDQLVNWLQALPAANIIGTTGAATAALELGQTGNRLAMMHTDLKEAQRRMDKSNVRKDGRVALIEVNMFQQMVDSLNVTQYRDFSSNYDPKAGTTGRLYGFDIMTRSSVAMAALGNGALSVNLLGQATSATDNVTCLCYQEETVSRALGTVKMYQRNQDPQYYGDIMSTRMRMGGRRRRGDDAGVIAIVQAGA